MHASIDMTSTRDRSLTIAAKAGLGAEELEYSLEYSSKYNKHF